MREFAKEFYNSRQWKKCRAAYFESVGGLCERCLKAGMFVPGEIVHHKIHIEPETLNDPTVALCFDNLELLCRSCHGMEHSAKRYYVDEFGRVINTR